MRTHPNKAPPDVTLSPLTRSLWAFPPALLIAIAPKCPFCWAAYLSLLGLSGIPLLALEWVMPVLIFLFLLHLSAIGKRACSRRIFLPLILSGVGFSALMVNLLWDLPLLTYPGILFIVLGSISSAISHPCAAATGASK